MVEVTHCIPEVAKMTTVPPLLTDHLGTQGDRGFGGGSPNPPKKNPTST